MINAILLLSFVLLAQSTIPEDMKTFDLNATMNNVMIIKQKQWAQCASDHHCPMTNLNAISSLPCIDGYAGEYPCSNIDLLSFLPLEDLGCKGDGNDIWGWTDVVQEREYAIFCCYSGTSFIDVTEGDRPRVIGFLPTNNKKLGSSWRDAKVYKDHVFIVSEEKDHGMQVFDLTRLRDAQEMYQKGVIVEFTTDAYYSDLGSVHNIVINEETGFAYAVGSRTCNSGLHIIDISNPVEPEFVSCYSEDGYTHDAQCVVYDGPDERFHDREICFCYNENTVTIVDVTEKKNMKQLSRTSYNGYQYTHQGWLLEGSQYLLANDELDEVYGTTGEGKHTRTMKWDVTRLDDPKLVGSFYSSEEAIDHNLYILGDVAYLANYCAGLRILDVTDIDNVSEIGYFDVSPDCSTAEFLGSWSSYPYFESGNIVVSSIERGLFVVDFTNDN